MSYVLTEEQQFLKDSAKDLFKKAPVALIRDLRDGDDEEGYSTDLWQQMVEMGYPGIVVSEASGGMDFGMRALGVLMEESGRSLSASPLLTVSVAAAIIEKYGSDNQKQKVTEICEKGTVVALALQEGNFYNPEQSDIVAKKEGDAYTLSGVKDMVADGHAAASFIVTANTDEGVTAFLIGKDVAGVSIDKEFMMDSRYYSKLKLENVSVPSSSVLGGAGKGKKVANDVTNMANALISNELVGVMSEAFDRTVAYLKERRQFEKEIGSFQGLQHRAADLYGEIEIAKSLAIKALDAIDEADFMAPAICSMAKAKCVKVSQLATNEGVQMFGGIGMTDDEEIGFFMKRARVASQQYGGYAYHVDRFATMNGY